MEKLGDLLHDNDILSCTAETFSLSENSREMVVHIGGHMAKKLKNRIAKCCSKCLIEEFVSDKNPVFSYIEVLSRGVLTIASMNLENYAQIVLRFPY